MEKTAVVDKALLAMLVCPRDHKSLIEDGTHLVCPDGHCYGTVDGIPVLLLSESPQTHVEGTRALAAAEAGEDPSAVVLRGAPDEIDPFVKDVIGATNGSLYQHLVGNLTAYPIPHLRLPPGDGKLFLEVGCNWGRWCIAAARAGYRPIGIDPSLKGIRAARQVARQLGVDAHFVVGDGRHLPFADEQFEQAFSYSVLQHLSKENTRITLGEMARVLRPKGGCLVQMPNSFGIRCLYHQSRRGFRETRDFEVRYWTPRELQRTFSQILGPSRVSVDGFFSLNPQISDLAFLPRKYRALVRTSEALRKASTVFPPLRWVADSLYVASERSQHTAAKARRAQAAA